MNIRGSAGSMLCGLCGQSINVRVIGRHRGSKACLKHAASPDTVGYILGAVAYGRRVEVPSLVRDRLLADGHVVLVDGKLVATEAGRAAVPTWAVPR